VRFNDQQDQAGEAEGYREASRSNSKDRINDKIVSKQQTLKDKLKELDEDNKPPQKVVLEVKPQIIEIVNRVEEEHD